MDIEHPREAGKLTLEQLAALRARHGMGLDADLAHRLLGLALDDVHTYPVPSWAESL